MLFSVVIPTYNRADLLPQTLQAVFAQTFTDYEVIVVDDGSTDGTPAVLARHADRIAVIAQQHAGPGAARNHGAAHARGDYVVFLDSDDLWFPWTLSVFERVISGRHWPAIVSAAVRQFERDDEVAGVREESLRFDTYPDYLASANTVLLIGSGTVAVRRSVLNEGGGFTLRKIAGEDQDLLLRLGTAANFVAISSPAMLAWRRHADGMTKRLEPAIAGSEYLIEQERAGCYPGGERRARQRREIITRNVRPVSFHCLRQGRVSDAIRLYSSTFAWHLRLGRLAYTGTFPFAAAWAAVKRPSQ